MGPQELLQQPVHVMVADFGIAEIFSSAADQQLQENLGAASPEPAPIGKTARSAKIRSKHVGGTPSYMSPEMFAGSFTEKCDIWSMGVIMFQVLTGELPYRGDNILML